MAISNKLAAMNGELDNLEQKMEQVLAICGELRAENRALRDQVAELEHSGKLMQSRAAMARERLEALMDKLPVE